MVERFSFEQPEEKLTGLINGKDASDLEERFYIVARRDPRVELIRYDLSFGQVPAHIKLDFWLEATVLYLVQIDGTFAHKSAATRAHDRLQDARLQEMFPKARPVSRITEKYLSSIPAARETLDDLLNGKVFDARR